MARGSASFSQQLHPLPHSSWAITLQVGVNTRLIQCTPRHQCRTSRGVSSRETKFLMYFKTMGAEFSFFSTLHHHNHPPSHLPNITCKENGLFNQCLPRSKFQPADYTQQLLARFMECFKNFIHIKISSLSISERQIKKAG